MMRELAWSRMPALERAAMHACTAALLVTGLALLAMQRWMDPPDGLSVISHPLQPLMQHAHVLAAPAFMMAFGMIFRRHVLARLIDQDARRARRSGVFLVALLVPMVASGYGLQVITHETWLVALEWTHLGAGVAFGVGFLAHAARALRRRSAP